MLGNAKASKIAPSHVAINQSTLDSLNVEQARKENRSRLDVLGGIEVIAKIIGVEFDRGLTTKQVEDLRSQFGPNQFPESPMQSYMSLLFDAFSDSTLLVLLAAAGVSLGIGVVGNPSEGWIEGAAIFIAVFLVANISAANDYTKEMQFRALELSSQEDERASVLRDGVIERINPVDLVVGDIVILQAGDVVPADCVLITSSIAFSNESSLTGESNLVKKTKAGDCFLLSSCLITDGEECRALVIGVGQHSQWGKIKVNLVAEAVNTPLQDKLEKMSTLIGYVGMICAFGTFVALVVSIWTRQDGKNVTQGIINAFILSITIVVVAIPEGLPLAVTIALAYSTKKMYKDQCFIRILAACETMGNATCICSDKTGTLTQNKMTVVEGWFGNVRLDQASFSHLLIPTRAKRLFVEHVCVNRTAYLVYKDTIRADVSTVVGNATEGVLIELVQSWGFDYDEVKHTLFNEDTDRVFVFNSYKKRASSIVHLPDGSVRLYCKGAPDWLLPDCSHYLNAEGQEVPITPAVKSELEKVIHQLASHALRTLLIAHRDFKSHNDLPDDWQTNPPDHNLLCCDCIVGIFDPLRPDVKDAVEFAQHAGVYVRMVTGDSRATAVAIAKQCGILDANGITIEGPEFRKLTPAALDKILPRLQVMARSSPDDKHLLVTRLNGRGIPATQAEWEAKHSINAELNWDTHRDQVLPGYKAEWEVTRPEGGEVVGVTGDGTNDAPALKAADVGLAMGITGTRVAQEASDIVILDDRFSSIVRSIIWGRSVYDNIRKFLQFQLTVNIVALLLVFIGAVAGFGQPLNAVQMLWVNLVMDTMGALALGTEAPTNSLLNRPPYKRSASLISRPMWRNILCQACFQVTLLLVLLFKGAEYFNVNHGEVCIHFYVHEDRNVAWVPPTFALVNPTLSVYDSELITCETFSSLCKDKDRDCYRSLHQFNDSGTIVGYRFHDLDSFEDKCLECDKLDYTHGTIIFNSFIFCQFFNEYSSRSLNDDHNMFYGLTGNMMFLVVSAFTVGIQVFLVEVGGIFLRTTPLTLYQWLITIALGAITIPVGVLMRFIPIKEDPASFAVNHFMKNKEGGNLKTIDQYLVEDSKLPSRNVDFGGDDDSMMLAPQPPPGSLIKEKSFSGERKVVLVREKSGFQMPQKSLSNRDFDSKKSIKSMKKSGKLGNEGTATNDIGISMSMTQPKVHDYRGYDFEENSPSSKSSKLRPLVISEGNSESMRSGAGAGAGVNTSIRDVEGGSVRSVGSSSGKGGSVRRAADRKNKILV